LRPACFAAIADLSCCAWSADGSPLLKALAAIHRASLRRLEGNRSLFPALRADRFRFHSLNAPRTRFIPLRAICLARLAPLRLVLEALVGEEHLFARGEDEFSPTIRALQDLVMVFHTLLRGRVRIGRAPRSTVSRAWEKAGAAQSTASGTMMARTHSRLSSARWHEAAWNEFGRLGRLVLLTPLFLTETLTREGLLGSTPFPGLHVVAVLLDLLDDVFRLHFPLETPESVFQRLALLNYNFCHAYSPPSLCSDLN